MENKDIPKIEVGPDGSPSTETLRKRIIIAEGHEDEHRMVGMVGGCGAGKDAIAVAKAMAMLEESGMEVVNLEDPDELDDFEKATSGRVNPYLQLVDTEPFTLHNIKHFDEMMYGPIPKKLRGLTVHPVRTEPKIFNNDPCPCGSGKKYKKCCKKINKK